jgi:uncharacterized repeat protein (TIGR01451 family)
MNRCELVETMQASDTRCFSLVATRNGCIAWMLCLLFLVGCSSGPRIINLSQVFAPPKNIDVDHTAKSNALPPQEAQTRPGAAIESQPDVMPLGVMPSAVSAVVPVTYEERFSDQTLVQTGPSVHAGASARVGDQPFTASPVGFRNRQVPQCQTPGCNNGCMACLPDAGAGQACGPGGVMMPMIPNPQGIDPNEFLCNGGDQPPRARARVGDQIIGVEVEDTVARYTTVRGETHVTPSNRVCVYAPRFGSVRRVTGADVGEMAVGPQRVMHRDTPIGVDHEEPGLALTGRDLPIRNDLVRGPDAMRARDRGVRVENVLQPEMAQDVLALLAGLSIMNRGVLIKDDLPIIVVGDQAATIWSVDQEVVVAVAGEVAAAITRDQTARELVVYDLPNGRLRLCKVADRGDALPGEIVTFLLRVDNVGDSPLSDIVLTDSLSSRLQYVPDSQKNSVNAEFSTSENDDNSLRMTWKFTEELKVGEGTTIEFKCRVR